MKRIEQRGRFILAAALVACLAASTMAADLALQTRLKVILDNVESVTPEVLQRAENADLLQELRSMATDKNQIAARALLIRLGDEALIQSSLNQLRSNNPRGPLRELRLAANPIVIPLLATDFNRDESPDLITKTYDVVEMPLSMNAAWIVKETIIKSPVFSQAVKEWARGLPTYMPGLRTGIRAWWTLNQTALVQQNYAAVVAPGE